MKSIKFYALHLLLTVALMSFTVKKDTPTYTPPRDETMRLIGEVLTKARTYTGTPYKWGGIKSSGLDCSALVVLSFSSIGMKLPRTSSEIADLGTRVSLKNINPGDLVFFSTSPTREVNHIGIVSEYRSDKEIRFIHSVTGGGVKEDNIFAEKYMRIFVKATRVFN